MPIVDHESRVIDRDFWWHAADAVSIDDFNNSNHLISPHVLGDIIDVASNVRRWVGHSFDDDGHCCDS